MNPAHLKLIVGVRWRMTWNQFRRAGRTNLIITIILVALGVLLSLGGFLFTAFAGQELLEDFKPIHVLYLWDVLGGLFLFVWMIALLTELQRSEMLSLHSLLHLPVSLSSAFVLNYLSSWISLSILLFLPAMLGFVLASVIHYGTTMLLLLPLLFGFLLMVTAVTYQLRGWLARMMQNKRRRGTVIAVTTFGFVLLAQIPSMLQLATLGPERKQRDALREEWTERDESLREQLKAKEITSDEFKTLTEASKETHDTAVAALKKKRKDKLDRSFTLVNMVLPIGWLPYGASTLAAGRFFPAICCILGTTIIGAVSLVTAYRSTIRTYTGSHNSEYRPRAVRSGRSRSGGAMLEKQIPYLTEQQAVMTLATIRSVLRAPEAKMALLTPLIFVCVFGSMIVSGGSSVVPKEVRPLVGLGAISMSLFGMVQFMVNMFGMDRHAFRAFVLMPIPRRDILLGKNLGILPFAGTMTAILLIVVQIMVPMQLTHFLATILHVAIVYLSFFVVSNYVSIVAPVAMAFGSMKPLQPKLGSMLLQFLAVILSPLTIVPAGIAFGAELLAAEFLNLHAPIYLGLTLLELPVAIWLYRRMLRLQGEHLREREQRILEVVSRASE